MFRLLDALKVSVGGLLLFSATAVADTSPVKDEEHAKAALITEKSPPPRMNYAALQETGSWSEVITILGHTPDSTINVGRCMNMPNVRACKELLYPDAMSDVEKEPLRFVSFGFYLSGDGPRGLYSEMPKQFDFLPPCLVGIGKGKARGILMMSVCELEF